MTLRLDNLQASKKRKKKRLGRGNASGRGTYSGRGQKGQRSRSGGKSGLKRLGVKSYLRQIPKTRGFRSHRPKFKAINISALEKNFKDGETVDNKKLLRLKLIDDLREKVKILGDGELKKKLEVKAHAFSKTAMDAINKAGGSTESAGNAEKKKTAKNNKK